ncbi:MAG: hypothetical protein ACSLFA_14715, partial [Mycobacterium sp.]
MTNKILVGTALTAVVLASAGVHSVQRSSPSAPAPQLTTFRMAPVALAALVTPNALYAVTAPVAASRPSGSLAAARSAEVFRTASGATERPDDDSETRIDEVRELFAAATLAMPTAHVPSGGSSPAFAGAAPTITAADVNN